MRQLQTLTMRLMNLLLQQALVQQFYKMMGTELQTFPVTPLVPLAPRAPMPEPAHEVQAPRRTSPPLTAVFSAPVIEQAGPMQMDSPVGTRVADTAVEREPEAKRQRTTVRRVGDEELVHVEMDVDELFEDVGHDAFFNEYFDSEDTADDDPFMDDDCLWQPFSELEPCLDPELLAKIDEW